MSREIKFRAWDNVDYMSTPFTLNDLQKGKIQFTSDCSVMQFTGMKDKKGKDIYEGDILKTDLLQHICGIKEPLKSAQVSVVFWNKEELRWMNKYDYAPNFKYSKIIGNIYENPNLLK